MSRHLVGILLAVYVKKPHAKQVKDVLIDTVGVGIMGVGVRVATLVFCTLFSRAIVSACFVLCARALAFTCGSFALILCARENALA